MKRIFLSAMMLVFVVASTSCFAYPAVDRVTGGLKDIATSPLKVSDNVKEEMNKGRFMPFGVIGGLLKGTFYMAKQIVDGTWTIVSTPYHMVK